MVCSHFRIRKALTLTAPPSPAPKAIPGGARRQIRPLRKTRNQLDIAINNECGRLLANVVTAFNSVLLSQLLERYQREGNEKALAMLKKISPVAWRHIHFLGHYTFRNENPIDIAAMLAGLDLL
ncbi:hypothetical protein E1N52_41155 [Paraburkholderia guartelaensis]|uniref:Tn3 transposase DDE domain-containing protein n=2 Tax=Paraburkholderia guartelaensis TaxID=2546446 RepID=A0A4R5L117_9BURK|nr:hypothetical protein E1N52_41155 [Paraburkholderia guartelaensis]